MILSIFLFSVAVILIIVSVATESISAFILTFIIGAFGVANWPEVDTFDVHEKLHIIQSIVGENEISLYISDGNTVRLNTYQDLYAWAIDSIRTDVTVTHTVSVNGDTLETKYSLQP